MHFLHQSATVPFLPSGKVHFLLSHELSANIIIPGTNSISYTDFLALPSPLGTYLPSLRPTIDILSKALWERARAEW